jgi:hypothetical protein
MFAPHPLSAEVPRHYGYDAPGRGYPPKIQRQLHAYRGLARSLYPL